MNKILGELVKIDSVFRADAIAAAAAAPAVSPLVTLGGKQRKARFCVTIASANLDNTGAFTIGIVDDTVVLPAATTDLAALFAADETLKYAVIAAGDLTDGCTALTFTPAYAAGTITINGTVFTYAAVPATALEFSDLATLIAAINGAALGITAAAAVADVTLDVDELGAETITFATTIVAIDAAAIIIRQYSVQMEVDASDMFAGATGVYAVVDFTAGTGAITVHGDCVRGHGRYTPEQAVAFAL